MPMRQIHEDVKKYLDSIDLSHVDGDRVRYLLDLSVGRVLSGAARADQAWQPPAEKTAHIVDWLAAAVVRSEPWIDRVDDFGRPRKVMKFGSFEAIFNEANKAMRQAISRDGRDLNDCDEQVYLELGGGYRLVRMMDRAALKRESRCMGHCVGNGAYDSRLENEGHVFLSLRDRHNKAHVTLHLTADGSTILQMQGKQNRMPDDKYLKVLAPFINSVKPTGIDFRAGVIMDDKGDFHCVSELPEGVVVNGTLGFYDTYRQRWSFPENMRVRGDLKLHCDGGANLPKGLVVEGTLHLTGLLELPSDLRVGSLRVTDSRIAAFPTHVSGSVYLPGSHIQTLPDHLHIKGDLDISNSRKIKELPRGLLVDGCLNISHTSIKKLPDDLKCGGIIFSNTRISEVPDGGVADRGIFVANDTPLRRLPAGLNPSSLEIARTKVTELPDRLEVDSLHISELGAVAWPRELIVYDSLVAMNLDIKRLPDVLKVGGSILLCGSKVPAFPTGLAVGNHLSVEDCDIENLPDGLSVGGHLIASNSSLRSIGRGTVVGGDLFAHHCRLSSLPPDLRFASRSRELPRVYLCGTPISELPALKDRLYDLDISETRIRSLPKGLAVEKLHAHGLTLTLPEAGVLNVFHSEDRDFPTEEGCTTVQYYRRLGRLQLFWKRLVRSFKALTFAQKCAPRRFAQHHALSA